MRAFQTLLHLPLSLLWTSFVHGAIAAPVEVEVELMQLTPDNFNSSIANGVW